MRSNEYILRVARTPRTCMVCGRASPLVLVSATQPEIDFFYICAAHLGDRGFASELARPAAEPAAGHDTPAPAEKRAAEPAGAPETQVHTPTSAPTSSPASLPPLPAGSPPLHTRFALHREFYAQRCRRQAAVDAQRRAPQFPAVPR